MNSCVFNATMMPCDLIPLEKFMYTVNAVGITSHLAVESGRSERPGRREYQNRALWPKHTQITILVYSKVAAILLCKFATRMTRQERTLETSYRKRVSHHASNLSQACHVKLTANYSKNRVRRQPWIRTLDIPLPKPVVLTTRQARLVRRR
ncbi:hypothetical protein AVEN_172627-1 [Araneus ventricosus]|uniref:Uncharacterized protein n=1 Tax=Araneus ventricosus TaxID=182803 RepID=A0A4Y2RKQ1_ARAVE|nr:hypothetical protein AVEN_172627-1 [Araneus ventricosus]